MTFQNFFHFQILLIISYLYVIQNITSCETFGKKNSNINILEFQY